VTPSQIQALSSLIAVSTVIMSVFSLALGTTVGQATWLLRHPGLLLRSILAALVLVPVISALLVMALGAVEPVAIALVLLAVSPAAPLMRKKAAKVSGDADYAPSLQLVLASLSIATVPLSLALLSALFPAHRAQVSPWAVASQVGRAQILPLLAGMALRAASPTWADRLARPLGKVAGILLAAIAVLVLVMQGKLLLLVGIGGYVSVVLAAVAAILLGHLMGGPNQSTRSALAIACAVRNPGIALLVVQLNFPGRGAGAVVLTYVLVSAVLLAMYGKWRVRGLEPAQPLA
jgi:bile acid:Na+ symporter, BASS family